MPNLITHPTTYRISVPITSIIEGDRVRTDYGDLNSLANSIRDEGLIHPIVINLANHLVAGGRRLHAIRDVLKRDTIEINYIETLDTTHLQRLEAEENVRRKDMTWQEKVRSVKLVHTAQSLKGALAGSTWTQRMTGELLGYSQAHVSYATQLATLIESNDPEINSCASFTDAIKLLTKRLEDQVTASLARTTIGSGTSSSPTGTGPGAASQRVQDILANGETSNIFSTGNPSTNTTPIGLASRPATCEMPADAKVIPPLIVPLSEMLIHADCIDWMTSQPPSSFDAIICDPPYAIDMDMLQQSNTGMDVSSTAAEHDIVSNISLLKRFIPEAARLLKDKTFLVLWCDFSQWNLLQQLCLDSGLSPQRWPLVWVKTSPCQNGAVQYNFTKNIEIALIARKGTACLTSSQSSCYWQGSSDNSLGHPFAKPANLWKWLFSATTIRGHRVLDPFAGCGSSTVAALSVGLSPIAIETNKSHHDKLIVNVANTYRAMHPNVSFI